MQFKGRLLAFLALVAQVIANQSIYSGGSLASGWENWSWNTVLDFASTTGPSGAQALSVASDAWSALSLKDGPNNFKGMAGLRFDISGAQPDISIAIQSTANDASSPSIPLSAISKSVTAGGYTTATIDFNNLPGTGATLPAEAWDRITIQAGGNGASYYLKNVELLTEIVITPKFLSAEPLIGNTIAVTTQGAVNLSAVTATLDGVALAITGKSTYSPPDTPAQTITYYTLAKALVPGQLSIAAGTTTFNYTLPAVKYGTINVANKKPISPLIYGINFPKNANHLTTLGATLSRWGGNAMTPYNPFGGFTNAGADWFFENRVSDPKDADDWVGWTRGASSQSMVSIPALDWVAKDDSSYSYPKTVYPDQSKFDVYKPDAGSGLYANGSVVGPSPPQTNAYTPWNMTLAKKWLSGLKNKPDIVTVDNEIEIASSTHSDMHPQPISFDEELTRVISTVVAAKEALPNVKVAAPSTCAWWFYWTSAVGYTDNAAHNNEDFLPWFLKSMKAHDTKAGKRYLDYLDIHYYLANTDPSVRLRTSRSFWDPSYIDESWIGTSAPQWHQPNPNAVWLIPRMKQLIAQFYPGTKLSISEWSSGADNELTGGLLTADILGVMGREGVDAATYWGTADEKNPVGLAYWLFNGAGTTFGANTVQVNMANRDDDILGVYAATTDGKKVSFVLINKDTKPVSLYISNIPAGTYFLRHFGGSSGVAKWQTKVTFTAATGNYLVLPAYTAVFLKQQ